MPRQPRLDVFGHLYHVMSRGIERREIFSDDVDRERFLDRLGAVLVETGTPIFAFALIPNHFHLLLLRGKSPISSVMLRLLAPYAAAFNKRHKRSGYLFQNRYKSIICQEDIYLLELIRYININPLRSKVVSSLFELESFAFSAHSYILGKREADWFEPDAVLRYFGPTRRKALNQYKRFINDGFNMGKRDDLIGGGLKRSLGRPDIYPKTKQAFDDRILGEGSFVNEILDNIKEETRTVHLEKRPALIIDEVLKEFAATRAELLGTAKDRRLSRIRAIVSYRLAREAGLSASAIARELGVTRSAAVKMIKRGDR